MLYKKINKENRKLKKTRNDLRKENEQTKMEVNENKSTEIDKIKELEQWSGKAKEENTKLTTENNNLIKINEVQKVGISELETKLSEHTVKSLKIRK